MQQSDLPFVHLTEDVLSADACVSMVQDDSCGGLAVFIGTVRNQTKGRAVQRLDFEAYAPMAIQEMERIVQRAQDTWPIAKMAMHHRVGTLEIGEAAVIIAVSTPHRVNAFQACQFAIDTLKETVPIWKKEIFEDGEVWVSAHP
ncbi:MAG: molybdenum cofactor biosynthesis protein MoaE [Bacteroidota bacterium]